MSHPSRTPPPTSPVAARAAWPARHLECLSDAQCENVFVEHVDVVWTEKPADVTCTLLGAVDDPAAACDEGTGTLVTKLADGRPASATAAPRR